MMEKVGATPGIKKREAECEEETEGEMYDDYGDDGFDIDDSTDDADDNDGDD